ncbi:MAG: glutamate synthase-related protein [Ferruginibacter sp.]
MATTKNIIYTGSCLTLIFILIIAVILKIKGTFEEKLFFGLLTTLVFLAIAIYFIHCIIKSLLSDYYLFNKYDHYTTLQIKGQSQLINHIKIQEKDLNILVGNSRCIHPYLTSILNITTFNNIGLNKLFISPATGKSEQFSLDKYITEDKISTYCLNAEDLVWQIGPAYLGCGNECGNFNAIQFKKNALSPSIRMIELKLSHASSSGYCSVLPSHFADVKHGMPENQGVLPSGHTAFRCAEGMILFVGKLQELSGGKPVGFRLYIDDKKEFYEICYAIRKTQIIPDFIVVDSPDDTTTGIAITSTGDSGEPLLEALQFVSKTLQQYGLDKEIKIIAAGRIISGFDVLKMIALGADSVYAFTADHTRSVYQKRYIEKSHNDAIKSIISIMKACGFKNRNDITLAKLLSRLDMLPLKAAEKSCNQKINMGTVKIIDHPLIVLKADAGKKHAAVL